MFYYSSISLLKKIFSLLNIEMSHTTNIVITVSNLCYN
ncbi:hypothetical protein FM106_02945 [Brachybacterium faecium]|nr:hypothetical protein FM106_02945 [Brachybacterium faecium]